MSNLVNLLITYVLLTGYGFIPHSTMQGLCLDNNEREETMNSYFADTANGDTVQSPVA